LHYGSFIFLLGSGAFQSAFQYAVDFFLNLFPGMGLDSMCAGDGGDSEPNTWVE
jgi:hypothetical protein